MVAALAFVVLIVGFTLWAAHDMDAVAFKQQSSTVERMLARLRTDIRKDLRGISLWDDTIRFSKLSYDADWLSLNIAEWFAEQHGHTWSMIVGANGEVVYFAADGAPATPAAASAILSPVAPIIARLQAAIAADASVLPHGAISNPPSVADFVLMPRGVALAAAQPIVSDTGAIVQAQGTENILISIRLLDATLAAQFADEYHLPGAAFTTVSQTDTGHASFPILNAQSRVLSFFEWQPYRPGTQFLRQSAPGLTAAVVLAIALVAMLLWRLYRTSSALHAGRQQAEYRATHDGLTDLVNRGQFDAVLSDLLRHPTAKAASVHLFLLDLDRFKQINDTHGHGAGDELIAAVAARLRPLVVAPHVLARLGGDEFAVLAQGRAVDPAVMSGRIIDALGAPFHLSRFSAHIGVSIGIVSWSGQEGGRDDLMRRADIALYRAKADGRNRAVQFEESMGEALQAQHEIEGELRKALQREDQLRVLFQPLIDQRTGAVIGAEALTRWHHPTLGAVSPARFIPVAESSGLIGQLGEWVLFRACMLGGIHPGKIMSVNISPVQLHDAGFVTKVFDTLQVTGMHPHDLELEITESILLDKGRGPLEALQTLRSAGIRIALDDFGTGYSSLAYLQRYPVDRIKIDRSFVCQLAVGHFSVSIIRAIVTLAHAMDLQVTAEGVETPDQAQILASLGCNTFQGFLFSPPIEAAALQQRFTASGGPDAAAA